ncbi:hypothetical protein ACTXT7_007465 [Hymenolepis weldensis]
MRHFELKAGIDKRLCEKFNRFAQEAEFKIQRNLVHPQYCMLNKQLKFLRNINDLISSFSIGRILEYHLRYDESITKNEAIGEVLNKSSTKIVDAHLNIHKSPLLTKRKVCMNLKSLTSLELIARNPRPRSILFSAYSKIETIQ